MSGKIVVGLIAVASAIAFGANLWFTSTHSPLDQRFNLRRVVLTKAVDPTLLLPEKIGDFVRQSVQPIQTNTSGDQEGSAAYADTDGKQLLLSVRKPASGQVTLESLTDETYRGHLDGPVPFAYSEATNPTFVWINGGWIIRVSTTQATADALLQLVNLYPF